MWHFYKAIDNIINFFISFFVKFFVIFCCLVPILFLLRTTTKIFFDKPINEVIIEKKLIILWNTFELTVFNIFLRFIAVLISKSTLNVAKGQLDKLNELVKINPSTELFDERIKLQRDINDVEAISKDPLKIIYSIGLKEVSYYTAQAALINYISPASVPNIIPYATRITFLDTAYYGIYEPLLHFYNSLPTPEDRASKARMKRVEESLENIMKHEQRRRNMALA